MQSMKIERNEGYHEKHGPNLYLSNWIASHFPPGFEGCAMDIGASDGISVNSTYGLEKQGWKVLCVEPNPQFYKSLTEHRKMVDFCACDAHPKDMATFHIHLDCAEAYSALRPSTNHPKWRPLPNADWKTIKVEVKTANQCLDDAGFTSLDALCIDTEGTELDVLHGINLKRWSPKVIVVEAWDEGACDKLLNALGYDRVYRLIVNDGYVRRDA